MKKRKKLSKIVLAFLLSAVMALEPAAGSLVVYAKEAADKQITVMDEGEGSGETGEDEGKGSGETGEDEGKGSGETDEGKGEGSGETDEGKGEGSGETDEGKGEGSGETDEGKGEGSGETDEGKGEGSGETDEGEGEGSGETGEGEETENPEEDAETEGEEELTEDELTEDKLLEEELSEEAEEEKEETDELDGFSSMPSGYALSSEQKAMKVRLANSMSTFDEEAEGTLYAEREVFVFADTEEEAEAVAEAYHAELIEYGWGVATLKLSEGTSVGKALRAAASSDNNLPAVYPNYYRYISEETTEAQDDNSPLEIQEEEYDLEGVDTAAESEEEDSEISQEEFDKAAAAYSDPYLSYNSNYYQWQHVKVGSVYAWNEGYTGQGIKVAVLDTGVTPMSGELTVSGSANTSTSTTTTDSQGHGTHVAGIIGARSNTTGGVGIAPNAAIYSVKVLGDDGSGKDDYIIRGIEQAMSWGVDIINMSLGGVGYNQGFQDVIDLAYNQGIAIFAAAGNDGGSNIDYPAGYNHVICVGAVDNNGQRASFSNYGSWVDLSAPGVDIWSTGNSGSYVSMSGTSMACPVAAGEAAVILSANVSSIAGKSGGKKVDALESFMKSNAVSAGSGMGKGVTSLTKAFKISVASAKPTAPVITAAVSSDAQKVTITIKAEAGKTIYYTTDGKAPSYKNGVAGANTQVYSQAFDISGTQKGTIQAIAVNESGVASSVKKLSFALKPYVTSITVSGVSNVAKGKSVQLKAEVLPAYAKDKAVTWTITKADGSAVIKTDGVSVSTSGKVTAAKNAVAGSYIVTATAKDGSGKKGTYTVVVTDTLKIASVKFIKTKMDLVIPKQTSYPLSDDMVAKAVTEGTYIDVTDFSWSSSNTAVATVSEKGVVTPKAAGSATITALANDSSGKTATCKITVKQQATGITITGESQVGRGKKLTLKATVAPTNTSNKKVTWKITKSSGSAVTKEDGVSINTSGVVTTTAKAVAGTYTVTAEAADGSGTKATKQITVKDGVISSITMSQKTASIFSTSGSTGAATSVKLTATLKGTDGFAANAYTVTNSNPKVAAVTSSGSSGTVTINVTATGKAAGKTTITVASTDGSNKKATCTVTVKGAVSSITMSQKSATIFRVAGSSGAATSVDLTATIKGSEGFAKDTYTVTSSNPGIATVTSQGTDGTVAIKVTATGKAAGKTTITVAATDGSKKKATCTVTVNNPVSRVNIAPTAGNTAYVAQGKSLTLKATLESEYGKVASTAVKWEIAGTEAGSYVKIDSKGKITVNKKATAGNVYQVTATAKDGSGAKATYNIRVTQSGGMLILKDVDEVFGGGYMSTSYTYTKLPVGYIFDFQILSNKTVYGGLSVTSSDPKVMSATIVDGYLRIAVAKAGSATITIKMNDGSGVQAKYKFTSKVYK